VASIAPIAPTSLGHEQMLEGLLAGDEQCFAALVDECQPLVGQVVRCLAPDSVAAEEAVTKAWIDLVEGLDDAEGCSSVRAWAIRRLLSHATARWGSGLRSVWPSEASEGPAVHPERFLPDDHATHPGHWATPVSPWTGNLEAHLGTAELRGLLREAIDALPPCQRAVVTLRDARGWSPAEVSYALGLSAAGQRAQLNRARSTLRFALEASIGVAA